MDAGVPVFVRPILAVVELMGMIVKPVALTIRLFANITAGHIIILSLVSLIFIFESFTMAPVSFIFVLFMNCLELWWHFYKLISSQCCRLYLLAWLLRIMGTNTNTNIRIFYV
jgi:F0F1-type ATP synthase membrane subunit a